MVVSKVPNYATFLIPCFAFNGKLYLYYFYVFPIIKGI